jgi:hypothetical protein
MAKGVLGMEINHKQHIVILRWLNLEKKEKKRAKIA